MEAASTRTAGAPSARAGAAVDEPFREPFVGQPEPAGQAELIGLPKDEIDTPALLLDLDRFERNASKISDFLRARGVGWRPHSKAHKSPAIARRQMQLGANGITCAKVSEAEVMVDHGIPSILVANEQGRRQKFDRLAALNRRAEVITCADSPADVGMASAAALAAGVEIPLLVDLNVGMERTGVAPGEAARDLARLIDKTTGVRFLGLMGYEGHLLTIWPLEEKERLAREQMGWMVETRRLIERDGREVKIVSGGGSGTYMVSGLIEGITEIQAGGACFMDRFYGEECHMEDDFEYALSVVTVTSRPIPGARDHRRRVQDDVRRRERPPAGPRPPRHRSSTSPPSTATSRSRPRQGASRSATGSSGSRATATPPRSCTTTSSESGTGASPRSARSSGAASSPSAAGGRGRAAPADLHGTKRFGGY